MKIHRAVGESQGGQGERLSRQIVVPRLAPYKEIDIFRRAWKAMRGERLRAHEEEPNALVGQALQHLFVVFVQHRSGDRRTARRLASAPTPVRAAPRGYPA
jgi:hypothetical protein